jgi:hypothetical protein
MTATGSYSDLSTADITNTVAWSVSDTSIVTINAANGQITMQPAGEIWGADVGVTATLAPGTPGTASLLVIASDSGSVAPRMPQQNNHWQALGLSPWGSWWGFQEASGSDAVKGSGSAAFDLTRTDGTVGDGTGVHQGVGIVGWTRVGAVISGTTNGKIAAAAGVGPDVGVTSIAWLGYGQIQQDKTGVAQAFMGQIANTTARRASLATTSNTGQDGALQLLTQLGSKRLVGPLTSRHNDRIHPFLMVYNRTTAELWGFTDQVVAMSGGTVALADDFKGFGAIPSQAALSSSWTWGAVCTGSVAESFASPSASADLFTRLGWYVPWKTCPTDSGTIKLPFLDMHWKELGLQTWTATWNMQDCNSAVAQNSFDRWEGNVSDGWQLTVGGTPTGGTAVPGWARRGVQFPNNSGQRIVRTCVSQMQWDPTGSQAFLTYVSSSVVGATAKGILGITQGSAAGNALTFFGVHPAGAQTPVLYCAGATATGSQTLADGRVHPLLIVYDKTNSRAKLYTDLEKLTGSFNALTLVANTTGVLTFGGTNSSVFTTSPLMNLMWGSFCTGTLAESFSDDGKASDLFKRLGWSVSW